MGGLAASLLWVGAAVAQTFQLQAAPVLEPVDGTFYQNGIGSPAVVWDPDQERYLMLFESRLTAPDTACPSAKWAIGVAWSADGRDWTIWDEPVLTADGGYKSCAVAHPTAIYEDGEVHLWFKAHDGTGATGVGYAHGNVNVLTTEERTEQLVTRGAEVDAARAEALAAFDAALEAYVVELRRERSTLARDSHAALMAGHDLDREIHAAQQAIAAGGRPDTSALLDDADALVGELDGNGAPRAVAVADDTEALLDLILAFEEEMAELDAQEGEIETSLEVVVTGGWVQEASFEASGSPVIAVSKFGYPSVAKVNGTYTMLLAKIPAVYAATSTDRVNWSVNWTPVMEPGLAWWAPDELYNPTIVCDEGSAYPYTTYFGGRDMDGWTVLSGGWSDAVARDGLSWLVNANPYFTFTGTRAWRHWDVLRVGDETVVWYSDQDAAGRNRIRLAYTSATWDPTATEPNICGG